jgi:hypothetical protein
MRYTAEFPGFEGHEIAVEISNPFGSPKLLVDGTPAPAGNEANTFALVRNDGKTATAQLKSGSLGSSVEVVIDGIPYSVMEPLQWYEWAWNCLPILLICAGGAVGGAFGGGALVLNLRVFRSQASPVARYLLTAAVTAAALAAYLVIAALITLAFSGRSEAPKPRARAKPAAVEETGPMAPGSPRMERHLRSQLDSPSLKIDEEFVRQVDAHAEKLNDRDRRQWQTLLGARICRSATRLEGDWIDSRLAAMLQGDSSLKREAACALLDRQQVRRVMPLFSTLDPPVQKALFSHLTQQAAQKKAPSGDEQELAFLALKAADREAGRAAFTFLCNRGLTEEPVRRELGKFIQEEKDAATRKDLEGSLVRSLQYQRASLAMTDYLDLAANGPCRKIVEEAVERLATDSANRNAHFAALETGFSQIQSPENRGWLLLEIKAFRVHVDLKPFYERGMSDASPSVRATAGTAFLESLRQEGPESEKIRQWIESETDSQAREPLQRAWRLWSVQRLEELRRSPKTRPEAHRKLVELAADPDEEVGMAAVNVLPLFHAEDKELMPSLLAVYQQAASPARKVRILDKLTQLEDDCIFDFFRAGLKDPAVEVRRAAFVGLGNNYRYRQAYRHPQSPTLLELMRSAADSETDDVLKKDMEKSLARLGELLEIKAK